MLTLLTVTQQREGQGEQLTTYGYYSRGSTPAYGLAGGEMGEAPSRHRWDPLSSGLCLCLKFPELKTPCQFLSTLCRRRLGNRSQGVGVEGRAGLFSAQPDILLP